LTGQGYPMLIHLLIGASLGVSAGAAPGPLQAYLLNQTTQHGWRRALPAVLAPLLSDIPIILLMLFILPSSVGSVHGRRTP